MKRELKETVAKLRELPGPRGHKKLAGNTYAYRDADGTVRVRYHETDVITVKPDGEIVLTSGGWQTSTTKERINWYINPFGIWQQRGIWYIGKHGGDNKSAVTFQDGMVLGEKHEDTTKETNKLRKRIFAYAKEYVRQLRDGEMEAPSARDCMLCGVLRGADSETLRGTEHLLSHLDEGYYVPRIMQNVLEEMPASPAMKHVVACRWTEQDAGHFDQDFVWDCILKALRRWLLRQFGLPS